MIEVEVRDGRIGRDQSLVVADGGELLMTFESERPCEEGDLLTLPDGTSVRVIGAVEKISSARYQQIVHIGDDFELPAGLPPVASPPTRITVPMNQSFKQKYDREKVLGAPLRITVDGRVTTGIVVEWIDNEDGSVDLIAESRSQ